METLSLFLGLALPGVLVGLVVFVPIWLTIGRSRPFLAGSICFALGMAVLVWLAMVRPSAFEGGYGIIGLLTYGGPVLLGIVSLAVGLGLGLRKTLPNLEEAKKMVRDIHEGQSRVQEPSAAERGE